MERLLRTRGDWRKTVRNRTHTVLGFLLVALTACAPALAGVQPAGEPRGDLESPTPEVVAPIEVPYDFDIYLYQGERHLGAQELKFSEVFAQNKPVVLNLWAGLCPTCRLELPLLQEAYVKYGDQVLFVGVDIGPFTGLGTQSDGRALLAELFVSFPAGGTAESEIMREYQVLGVPETLLFSADGELVDRFTALVNKKRLEQKIEALIDR
jgi:thiol-disulfide isomerase/thioredoxin